MRFFVFINAMKEEELNMTGSLLIDAMQVVVVFYFFFFTPRLHVWSGE